MYLPKTDVYNYLKALESEIDGLKVYQTQPEIFKSLPVITFYVSNNSINTFVDKSIAYQDITITIDIWTKTSSQGSTILNRVEEIMRTNSYVMEFSSDIPNADENVKHINCRFTTKI